jgi:hypothetical protein
VLIPDHATVFPALKPVRSNNKGDATMSEQILAMSGDFDTDFNAYQQVIDRGIESAALTIVECGTINCTATLC